MAAPERVTASMIVDPASKTPVFGNRNCRLCVSVGADTVVRRSSGRWPLVAMDIDSGDRVGLVDMYRMAGSRVRNNTDLFGLQLRHHLDPARPVHETCSNF